MMNKEKPQEGFLSCKKSGSKKLPDFSYNALFD